MGTEMHDGDDVDRAVHLMRRMALAMLQWLDVKPSCSRARVSDDNAYAESLFRIAKCRPDFRANGIAMPSRSTSLGG